MTVVAFTIWKLFRQRFYQDKKQDNRNQGNTVRQKTSFTIPTPPCIETNICTPQMYCPSEEVRTCSEIIISICSMKKVVVKIFSKLKGEHPWWFFSFFLMSCRSTSCTFTKERNPTLLFLIHKRKGSMLVTEKKSYSWKSNEN